MPAGSVAWVARDAGPGGGAAGNLRGGTWSGGGAVSRPGSAPSSGEHTPSAASVPSGRCATAGGPGRARGGGGGGWAGRGWRGGRLCKSSGIRPGGPPPPAAAPRAAARHRRLPGGVNIGGPRAGGGAQTWGETGLPPPLCFCARGRGERADTHAFALGYGGAARAPPARPGEDKGAAGDEKERRVTILQACPGEPPTPSPARLCLPSWTLQGPGRPRRPPLAAI